MSNPDLLARFHADPSKVRVSVRRVGDAFMFRVSSLVDPTLGMIEIYHDDPESGLVSALQLADDVIPGIDLGLDRAYMHPMGAAGVKNRGDIDEQS